MELQCWKEKVDAYSIWCVSHNLIHSMSSSTHYPIIIESITKYVLCTIDYTQSHNGTQHTL